MIVAYVDPDNNRGYIKHRQQRDMLELQYRRLLSVQGRLQAQQKKEEATGDSLEAKNKEIDKLKQGSARRRA